MRTWFKVLTAGLVCCLGASPVRAGVYSSVEPKFPLSDKDVVLFLESMIPIKQLPTAEAKEPWQKYYRLAATGLMAAKEPLPDTLSVENLLNLGTCLLRVREPGKDMPQRAIGTLKAAARRAPDNFLVMSTLGTAYQMTGDYTNARQMLFEARTYWRRPFADLSEEHRKFLVDTMHWAAEHDWKWYSTCEDYHYKLVKTRERELKKSALGFKKALEQLDPLFDPDPPPKDYKPLQFVGEDGKFTPGKIAKAEKDKLPPNAIEIVEQLLLWLPDDLRLYWMLGELFNAKGDVGSAKIVLTEFLAKYSQQERFSFRKIKDVTDLLPEFVQDHPAVGEHLKALLDYVPPKLPPPDFGAKDAEPKHGSKPPPPKAEGDEKPVAPVNLDWQALGVGVGAGAIVGFLVAWRIRDFQRRRRPSRQAVNVPSDPR
jgi:tetratricopeptide (TPR) repeat protein